MLHKNLLLVMAIAINSLAFMPTNELAQPGDNYFMEVLDTNDVAVGGIFEITLEVAWVNLDPPGSGIECVDAWEQGASIYQRNVDGLIPENATLS